MRPSLLPGLISAARRNAHRGFGELGLFEVGQVFESDTPEGQHNHATGLRTGTARFGATGRHWRYRAEKVDVFEAKADAAAVLEALGFDTSTVQVVAEPATWSHPGRGGRFQLGPKRIIAWFGEVHPRLLAEMDIAGPVAAFEIDLDAIPEPKVKPTRAKPALEVSDLMAVKRDFAFVVDRSVEAAKIVKSARGADKSLITDVTVFDLFEGASLGEDRKSVAIEVTLQPRDKTLTDAEIEAVGNSIVAAVERATGGTLRG
jgi:phenylalanyl-tRNA synthetase beta chain